MDLNSLLSKVPFLNKNTQSNEFYFALNIQEREVIGAVWGLHGKHLQIVNTASAKYEDHSDLIEAANKALDYALADFQPEPTKVLFGVPDGWLQDDNLKEEYLKLLRHLVKELDIIPMAYVSSTHAIAHLLEKQAGVPTTAILVEADDPLSVAVAKAGKIVNAHTVKRVGSLAEDIEKALASFNDIEVLPSKIVLYGKEDLEKHKEALSSFSWMPKLPFLHLPKIDILEEGVLIKALCLAGASELNPDVAYPAAAVAIPAHPNRGMRNLEPEEAPRPVGRRGGIGQTGFVAGDIEKQANLEEVPEDVKEQLTAVDQDEVELHGRGHNRNYPAQYQENHEVSHYHSEGGILGMIKSIPSRLPIPALPGGGGSSGGMRSKLKLIIPLAILVILIGLYIYIPRGSVAVLIDPKVMEKDAQIIADPNLKEIDEANKKIPAEIIQIEETGDLKAQATGKKQVGESAKGTVNVYNLTNAKVALTQGTVLTGSNGLKFTLDTSVTVASQSSSVNSDFSTVTSPGKASSGVTASAIGPDSNLAAGTQLSVAGYNTNQVVAKVDSALTGGTSKDVMVVTADDQKKLLAALTSQLREKAQTDLQGKVTGDQKVLREALVEKINSQKFSKAVGDQASEFNLSLSANYSGSAYSDQDLKQIISKLVITEIPQGYELSLSDSETQADVGKIEKDGRLIFNARFKAKLIPKFDQKQLKNEVKGKTPAEVDATLKKQEHVVGSEVTITPKLPGPLYRLPFLTNHFSLVVKPK